MSKKQGIRAAVMAAFLAASGVSGVAYAVDEVEQNHPISQSQRLTIGSGGSVTVKGVIGNLTGPAVLDADFYSFYAKAGDVLDIDIDDGYRAGARSVDTFIAIFGPGPNYAMLKKNDDSELAAVDPGSVHRADSYISKFLVETTGIHTVGVSSYPRYLTHGGIYTDTRLLNDANGDYTLIITGVLPTVQQINIDIKPGSGEFAPVNPKAKGNIPVALLSSSEFDALLVEPKSLRFGSTGNEESWLRCSKEGTDVNGDGRLDLVCHFENQAARFDPSNEMATIKGNMLNGTPFEGSGLLKIVPVKRQSE